MCRNDQEDIEELIETIKAHCPYLANSENGEEQVNWFANAIVFDFKHGVASHRKVNDADALRKVASALKDAGNLISNLPEFSKKSLTGCLPTLPTKTSSYGFRATLEEALSRPAINRVELTAFVTALNETADNIDQMLLNNPTPSKRRASLDYEAIVVYRICLKIWREELILSQDNQEKFGKRRRKLEPNKFSDDHADDPQGSFIGEVFNTLGIKTKVSSAAKRLNQEGGEEALVYNHVVQLKE